MATKKNDPRSPLALATATVDRNYGKDTPYGEPNEYEEVGMTLALARGDVDTDAVVSMIITTIEDDRAHRPAVETEDQRNVVLGALFDKLFEVDRYLVGAKRGPKPAPEEDCCDIHRARWQRDRELYLSLRAQRKTVKATIALFSKEIPS